MVSPITHVLGRLAGQAGRLLSRLAKPPKTGPITGAQSLLPTASPFGSSPGNIPGFASVGCGAYDVYRKISSHPTVAEVMAIVKAPILSNRWVWHKLPDAPESWRIFVEQNLDPLRTSVLKDGLRALEFGCWKFEKVWCEQSGRLVLQKLKSLNVDPQFTRIRVDPDSGDFLGLEQTGSDGQIIFLGLNKCFLYTYDGEPGQYHGRSRHENIRKDYFRYEEVAQRLAQYLRKVAGIIVQLHYPDGTSKTASGADFPNDWIAQQILDAVSEGRSIRFQNLFSTIASSSDLRPADMEIAARLAGESQWKLSAVDVGSGADHAQGLLDALAYYDKLLFRGWQRSERVGLEAHASGSRADSQSHSDTGLIDSQLIEADFIQAFRAQVVDDLLSLNFGPQARGAVWPVPNPIADNSNTTQAQSLITQGLSNPKGFAALAAKIDWDTLLATANIPTDTTQRGSIGDTLAPQDPEPPAAQEPESPRMDMAGFNPFQPRDWRGRWAAVGEAVGTLLKGNHSPSAQTNTEAPSTKTPSVAAQAQDQPAKSQASNSIKIDPQGPYDESDCKKWLEALNGTDRANQMLAAAQILKALDYGANHPVLSGGEEQRLVKLAIRIQLAEKGSDLSLQNLATQTGKLAEATAKVAGTASGDIVQNIPGADQNTPASASDLLKVSANRLKSASGTIAGIAKAQENAEELAKFSSVAKDLTEISHALSNSDDDPGNILVAEANMMRAISDIGNSVPGVREIVTFYASAIDAAAKGITDIAKGMNAKNLCSLVNGNSSIYPGDSNSDNWANEFISKHKNDANLPDDIKKDIDKYYVPPTKGQ